MCRNCYQPLKEHEKNNSQTPPSSPRSPLTPGGSGKEAKVFQRFRVNREQSIDHSVAAKERTSPAQNLEGITVGKVAGIVKPPSPVPSANKSISSSTLPKPVSPSIVSSGNPPTINSHHPPPPAVPKTTPAPTLVTKAMTPTPVAIGTSQPRTTSASRLPSRPPPPVSAVRKPPPPAVVGKAPQPPPTTVDQPPTKPTTPAPAVDQPPTEPETQNVNQLTTTDTVTETENTLPNKEINIDSGNIESDRTKMEGTGVSTPSPQAVQASDKKEGVFSSAISGECGAVVNEVMEVVEIKQDNQPLHASLPLSFDAGVEYIADQNGEEEVLVQAPVNDGITLEEHAEVSEATYDSQMPEAPEATQEVVSEGTQEEVASEGTQEEVVKEGTQEVVKVDTQVGASEGTQEVVSELAEVTKETEVVVDVTESLKYAANKIAEQSTESQLDDNEQRGENGKVGGACNEPDNEVDEEVGVACNEPDNEDDEEVGVASDEPDGIVSEGIDGGREIVKSIKRRLSIKKKPKNKPKNKPVTENSSPTAVQTPLEQGETFSIHCTAVLAFVGYP